MCEKCKNIHQRVQTTIEHKIIDIKTCGGVVDIQKFSTTWMKTIFPCEKKWTLLPCQLKYATCTTIKIVLCQFKHRSVNFVKAFLKLFFLNVNLLNIDIWYGE
jgi:hypothetical protein